jgi:hypothetical protein
MDFTVDAVDGHLLMDGATTNLSPPSDQVQLRSQTPYVAGNPVTLTLTVNDPSCNVVVTLADTQGVSGPSATFTLSLAFSGTCTAVCSDVPAQSITADYVCTSCTRAPTPIPMPIAGRKLLEPPFAYDCGTTDQRVYVDVFGVDITTVDGSVITVRTFPDPAAPATPIREEYTLEGAISATGSLDVRYNISIPDLCDGDVVLTGQERPWPRVNNQFGIMDLNFQVNFNSGLCTFVCQSQDVNAMLYNEGQPIPTYAPTAAPTSAPTKKPRNPKTMSGTARSGAAASGLAAAMVVAAMMR